MALVTYSSSSQLNVCSLQGNAERLKLLAIETSGSACSLAIQNCRVITVYHAVAPRMQTQLILPQLKKLLAACHLALNDLDGVVYGCGPGSFTGVRIAACVAQGITYATQAALMPISSLAGLAQYAYQKSGHSKILTAIDARAGQIYLASFLINSQGLAEPCQKEGVFTLLPQQKGDKVFDFLSLTREYEKKSTDKDFANEKWFAIGNGWRHHEELLNNFLEGNIHGIDSEMVVNASALLPLGYAKIKEKPQLRTIDALPVYLR